MLEAAESATGLADWGDLPFLEALDTLLWSLEHEAGIAPERLETVADQVFGRILEKRLRLVADRKTYPRIADQEVAPPIVIVGLPRTGSTHLHALMALEPSVRAPLQWEMDHPSPPPGAEGADDATRIAATQAALDGRPFAAELMVRHPFSASRPEQCIGLLDWSFVNHAFMSRGRLTTYYEWFLAQDHGVMFEHHHRALQHLQAFRPPARWVLKNPKHMFSLDALLRRYPDAMIVWTHRDPVSVIPSSTDLVFTYRKTFRPDSDPKRFGPEWSAMEELNLLRGLQARDRLLRPEKVCDVHFPDLMADPVKAVTGIYEYFGLPQAADLPDRINNFMAANPRDKHGVHKYTPEDYGLDAAYLARRFSAYVERFGIRPDRRS
jgi:hypothetical protein